MLQSKKKNIETGGNMGRSITTSPAGQTSFFFILLPFFPLFFWLIWIHVEMCESNHLRELKSVAVVEARQRQIVSETAADSFILDLHCHSLIALSLLQFSYSLWWSCTIVLLKCHFWHVFSTCIYRLYGGFYIWPVSYLVDIWLKKKRRWGGEYICCISCIKCHSKSIDQTENHLKTCWMQVLSPEDCAVELSLGDWPPEAFLIHPRVLQPASASLIFPSTWHWQYKHPLSPKFQASIGQSWLVYCSVVVVSANCKCHWEWVAITFGFQTIMLFCWYFHMLQKFMLFCWHFQMFQTIMLFCWYFHLLQKFMLFCWYFQMFQTIMLFCWYFHLYQPTLLLN